ncbi:MAG TPA: alcohol dehydrogenase catalytic domain-containing protein [Labilithrix sp.]
MRQLSYVKPRTLRWVDVAAPTLLAPTDAVVRPFVAARCDGDAICLTHDYERAIRIGAAFHVLDPELRDRATNPFLGPFAYGHECVAEVVSVGDDVRSVRVGDRVIVPWAVSCGACARCRRGLTSKCEVAGSTLSAFGFGEAFGRFGGMVSDALRVPFADAMLVVVPAHVDSLAVASASDNLVDAYRAVGPALERNPGAPVLVVGGGAKSIGLYAAGLAAALGASRVDYVDTSTTRLDTAAALGANPIRRERGASWWKRGEPLLRGGYAISVEASSETSGLLYALAALEPGGECTAIGFYMRKGTPLPLWQMYLKSVVLHVGVSHVRAHLPAVLDIVARGAFDPRKVGGIVADWDDAPRALCERATKVVITRKRDAAI